MHAFNWSYASNKSSFIKLWLAYYWRSAHGGKDLFLSEIKAKYKFSKNKKETIDGTVSLHAAGIQFEFKNGEIMKLTAPYPRIYKLQSNNLKNNL